MHVTCTRSDVSVRCQKFLKYDIHITFPVKQYPLIADAICNIRARALALYMLYEYSLIPYIMQ